MANLKRAAERLHLIERLLLEPSPQAIREAEVLLQETASLMKEDDGEARMRDADLRAAMNEFGVLCARVGKLLEGARRAQWIRMRLITSLTQTYTARAETKIWRPRSGTVNISM